MTRRTIEQRKAQLQAELGRLEQLARKQRRAREARLRFSIGSAILNKLDDMVRQRDEHATSFIGFVRRLSEESFIKPSDNRARDFLAQHLADLEAELAQPLLEDASDGGA